MIGQTVSHYKILDKIGEGGMGEVFLAEDTKLHRQVALKFLPKAMTADPEAKVRFEREAQAAAALNHTNIVTVYEIGEHDGQIYIAMEYVEGQTLKDIMSVGIGRVPARGQALSLPITPHPLPLAQVIDIATQLASGLAAAHEKGIVHRDIKPQNIIIDKDNRVKILDFGLAKLKGVSSLTKESSTLGTVHYMSPEQTLGKEVDHRTDIWSLGVVLYEMLTGKLPFKGDYEQAVIYSILNEQPGAIDLDRKDIPKKLRDIVYKSIEKNSALRYQNMNEVVIELKEAKVGYAKPKKENTILVLPFDDMSPGKDNEYFSDGLTEELITDLSGVHDLLVISRSSAMTFKGTKKTIREIAAEVNVQYVLEGSVRKAGNKLRITAQLIDAIGDTHLWAEKYGGTLDDVFDIQEKVSRSIVDSLRLKLTPAEAERLAERPIPSAMAYEFYLKARQEILKWTEAGLENALRYLQNGLEIAGENALLYAGMAYVYFQYYNIGLKEEDTCRKQAEDHIQKAFALDPECPHANFVRAMLVAWYQPKEGIKYFQRVLDKNPNDFDTLFFFSCFLGTLGQKRVVVPLEERTIKIDPLNPAAHFHSGFNRLWEGEYALALKILGRLHQAYPMDVLTKWSYGLSLAYMDKKDEAGMIFEQVAREQPGTVFGSLGMAFKNALAGKRPETLAMLDANPCLQKPLDFQFAYWKTECFALIGEKERALDWLEQDINLGMSNYPLMSELDPFLASIRGEERFKKLMERVKYDWEHFEVPE